MLVLLILIGIRPITQPSAPASRLHPLVYTLKVTKGIGDVAFQDFENTIIVLALKHALEVVNDSVEALAHVFPDGDVRCAEDFGLIRFTAEHGIDTKTCFCLFILNRNSHREQADAVKLQPFLGIG